MLCKYNERYGNVCYRNGRKIAPGEVREAAERLYEREVGKSDKARELNAVCKERTEGSEVNDLKSVDTADVADNGEYHTNRIAGKNTYDEGDKLYHLLTVGRTDNYNEECYESADNRNPDAAGHDEVSITVLRTVGEYVVNRRTCKRKTDKSNGRADNCRGHKLVDPRYANELNYKGDNNVNKTRKDRTYDKAEVADAYRNRTCKRNYHRADKCE